MAGKKIAELTRATSKRYWATLAETPVIANRVHSILHTLFDWAVETDLITSRLSPESRGPTKKHRAIAYLQMPSCGRCG